MAHKFKRDWAIDIAITLFLFFLGWWVVIYLAAEKTSILFTYFTNTYGLMAVWGGVWGIHISRKWGGMKSILGKTILMFALGLLAQEFGQVCYMYYIYMKGIEIPYPSIGDIGYFGSIPLYIYGVWLLGKASGVKIGIASIEKKIGAVIIPLVVLGLGYILFLKGYEFDWSNKMAIFLDFAYPFGEAIYVSLTLLVYLLSKNILGGVMRNKILLILAALLVQFASDYTFLYKVKVGTWYAGGPNDFMYFTAYFIMTLALLQLNTSYIHLGEEPKKT